MQRQVPQFIEIEDKIFGPFTLKQFSYFALGFGLSVIIWRTMPLSIGMFLIIPILAFTFALAYYKFNGKPFIATVQAFFFYFWKPKQIVWKTPNQEEIQAEIKKTETQEKERQEEAAKDEIRNTHTRGEISEVADRLDQR